jgi:hypothetical protein
VIAQSCPANVSPQAPCQRYAPTAPLAGLPYPTLQGMSGPSTGSAAPARAPGAIWRVRPPRASVRVNTPGVACPLAGGTSMPIRAAKCFETSCPHRFPNDTELVNTQERVKAMMERIKAFAQELGLYVRRTF